MKYRLDLGTEYVANEETVYEIHTTDSTWTNLYDYEMYLNWNAPYDVEHTMGFEFERNGYIYLKPGGYLTKEIFKIINNSLHTIEVRFIEGFRAGETIYIAGSNSYTYTYCDQCASNYPDRLDKFIITGVSDNVTGNTDLIIRHSFQSYQTYYNWYGVWDYGGLKLPTPTPEPSPTPGYCGEVHEPGEDPGDDDGFHLPIIETGKKQCAQVGGWTIPLGWIEALNLNLGLPEDIVLPGIWFCFVPIFFGELTIFGIIIDLDFIAIVMAGVVLFRLIFRS